MHLIAHLKGYLVSVWHLGVGQDRHHPLLVVDRLRRSHRERQSLMFQKIAAKFLCFGHIFFYILSKLSPYVRVVTNKILKAVELSASNIIVTTHSSHSKKTN